MEKATKKVESTTYFLFQQWNWQQNISVVELLVANLVTKSDNFVDR